MCHVFCVQMSNLSTDKEEAERRIKELSTKEARLTDDKQVGGITGDGW